MAADDKTRRVPGSSTFGSVTKPKGGRRQPRAQRLKDEAMERLVRLFEKGADGDPMARDPGPMGRRRRQAVEEQREFASSTPEEQLRFLQKKRDSLVREMEELEYTAPQRRRALMMPAILRQIEDVDRRAEEVIARMRESSYVVSVEAGDLPLDSED